jgi:hypothetical protein
VSLLAPVSGLRTGKASRNGEIHDLRLTGLPNLIRSGVPQWVAMAISGHNDASVFRRYDIVDERDFVEATRTREIYEEELLVLHQETFKLPVFEGKIQ